MDPVYVPAEDSYLLGKHVEELVEGVVLDVGTGSGIQAVTAARKRTVTEVVAVDIDPEALEAAGSRAASEDVADKIRFIRSDLFSAVEGRFDWILFNPPYLPDEAGISDSTWGGWPTGGEVIERFLREAPRHIAAGGSILLVYSSETKLPRVNGYEWSVLEEKRVFFETLTCARLRLVSPS